MRISSASVVVLVPSERVFAFIRDRAKLKCWQPDVIDSHLLSGDGSAAGSRWRVTLKDPARGRFELEMCAEKRTKQGAKTDACSIIWSHQVSPRRERKSSWKRSFPIL